MPEMQMYLLPLMLLKLLTLHNTLLIETYAFALNKKQGNNYIFYGR